MKYKKEKTASIYSLMSISKNHLEDFVIKISVQVELQGFCHTKGGC